MNMLERPNGKGDKITFYYDYGRGPGQQQKPNAPAFPKNDKYLLFINNYLLLLQYTLKFITSL
jgi:hypothetical protein